jgi:hypothetical protein
MIINQSLSCNPISGVLRRLFLAMMLALGPASAADIDLSGTCGWTITGDSIDIVAGRVENNSTGGSSGSLRLQVWATPSRYSGGSISGYVIGTRNLQQLSGGYSYSNISGSVSFTAPPSGTYYTTLTVEEYTGSGFVIRDYQTFSDTATFGGGGGGGDDGGNGGGGGDGGGGSGGDGSLGIEGSGSWEISGSSIVIGAAKVANGRSGGSSGSLRLQIWATTSPYSGGGISGYVIGTLNLDPLPGGYSYNNLSRAVNYTAPPSGTYYTTLTLAEYDSGSYGIVDYLTFSGTSTFGGGGNDGGGGGDDGGGGGGGDSLELEGTASYKVSGKRCDLRITKVVNNGSGKSGSLRLRLWATSRKYSGGRISGYPFAVRSLGQLRGGYHFNNVKGFVSYKKPPKGRYYVTLTLEEYTSEGYKIKDYLTFNSRMRVW